MSYSDYESSTAKGHPITLYLFRYGSDPAAFHAFTDADAEVTYGGVVYSPVPISMGKLESKGRVEAKELDVEVSRDNPIAQLLALFPPSYVISLVIRAGHVPDPAVPGSWAAGENFPVVWTGQIIERSAKSRAVVRLVGASSGAGMKRPGLTHRWQYACQVPVYSAKCGADKAAATTTATAITVGGNRITMPDTSWIKPGRSASDYIGGLVEWAGPDGPEYRTIIDVIGSDLILVLNGLVFNLTPPVAVQISLGCPHTLAGCAEIHDNVQNYRGYPFIPGENPVGKNTHD